MKKGDVIEIEYVGKIKETGKVFDLTSEDVAKENGVYISQGEYGPRKIVLGADYILKGLDEKLKKMNVGEKKEIELSPDLAFGKRNPNLVKLVSEKRFKSDGVKAEIGTLVSLGTSIGKVISKGAGRVKVDLNHPLAGKKLVYTIKINKQITENEEKLSTILKHRLGVNTKNFALDLEKKTLEIKVKDITDVMQKKIVSDVKLCFSDIEKVNFK